MIDTIFVSLSNVIGIVLLFAFSTTVVDMIAEHLTTHARFSTTISEFDDKVFRNKRNSVLIKGFFICVFIGFMVAMSLGRVTCDEVDQVTQRCETYDESSSFTPTDEKRLGLFTTVFSYTYIIVLASIKEGNGKLQEYRIESEKKQKTQTT